MIFSPRLAYHSDLRYTERDNCYLPYDELVGRSEKTAYISTINTPLLDERLRSEFGRLGVTWHEQAIGDYHRVFYDLSRAVHPLEMGMGVTRK